MVALPDFSPVRLLCWVGVAGVLFVLLAAGSNSRPAPATAGNANGIFLGVWQPGAPADMAALARFERNAGKRAAIVHWFQGWGAANAALDPDLLAAVAGHGSVPMISWEPWDYTKGPDQPEFSLANIGVGAFDAYAATWAKGLAAYGGPVMLRWAQEMNLSSTYPWSTGVNGNTPELYVAAWRHLHDLFVAQGATNVLWVWSPGVEWDEQTAFERFYPGGDYVDWVALDGYNNVAWGGWRTFADVFAASYGSLTSLSAGPVMIAEFASAEHGGSKAEWIADALTVQVPVHFPRVRAVVWFNENQRPSIGADWQVESSPATQAAFARAVASPVYLGAWPFTPNDSH
jgi:hypothetical protein